MSKVSLFTSCMMKAKARGVLGAAQCQMQYEGPFDYHVFETQEWALLSSPITVLQGSRILGKLACELWRATFWVHRGTKVLLSCREQRIRLMYVSVLTCVSVCFFSPRFFLFSCSMFCSSAVYKVDGLCELRGGLTASQRLIDGLLCNRTLLDRTG